MAQVTAKIESVDTDITELNKELTKEMRKSTTLDAHLTIGGKFFDVLQGTFTIKALNEREAVLHLQSQYRLSTPFNLYAAWWSDTVMRSIQDNILQVIKGRCEGRR